MAALPHLSRQRPSVLKYVYTHNPFYAISAVLMLYAVRAAYAALQIGAANCWLMTGVLGGYTLVLALIGVLIVRWGQVWEDARSILLLLLVLFLAVSISADALFVRAETSQAASRLLLCGFLFSSVVSEAVLWGTGVRLGARYRLPYHLMLALFYVAPWWYSPGVHPRSEESQDWMLLLFPAVASVLFLSLWPAVRGGERSIAQNGTPWRWPEFPGTAFGVIAAAVGLRSFALSMTFGLDGSIWRKLPGGRVMAFDTIWGPYFLVPLAFVVLLLLLEIGLVARNKRLVLGVMKAAPVLVLLALPWMNGTVFREFLEVFIQTVAAPLWLATWLLLGFYGWAWLRGVKEAGWSGLSVLALLSIVGPRTTGPSTLTEPQPWPFLLIGAAMLINGILSRSSRTCTAATGSVVFALWLWLPETPFAEFRMAICFNVLWLAVLICGLTFHDPFAAMLRAVSAAVFPVATLVVIAESTTAAFPQFGRLAYIVVLTIACWLIARWWRSRWFFYGLGGMIGVVLYAGVVIGFRRVTGLIGRDAMTAFVWSLGTLVLAFLISAQKARWLPRRLWHRWNHENGTGIVLPPDRSQPANGLSPDATP